MTEASAAKAEKPEKEEKAPAVRPLPEPRLKLVVGSASDVGNRFAAVTPVGTPFEHVLQPEFWALTAYKLRPGDEIDVHTDDMTYYGKLYVRDVSGAGGTKRANRATVAQLALAGFALLKREMQTKSHEVTHLGPHEKWLVVARADGRMVKGGFGTPEEAAGWMRTLS